MFDCILRPHKYRQFTFSLAVFLGGSGLALHVVCQAYVADIRHRLLPLMHFAMLTSASSSSTSQAPERKTPEHTPCHSPGRMLYQTSDDTLPSPPVFQQDSYAPYISDQVALTRVGDTLSDDQATPPWMLQETLTTEEEMRREDDRDEETAFDHDRDATHHTIVDENGNAEIMESFLREHLSVEMTGQQASEEATLHFTADEELRQGSAQKTSGSQEAVVETALLQRPSSSPPISTQLASSCSGSHSTRTATHFEDLDSNNDDSLPIIEVHLPLALLNNVSRAPSAAAVQGTQTTQETEAAAAKLHRPKVLVSPTMVDDLPDAANSWMPPGWDYRVYYQSLTSVENTSEGQCRGVGYTKGDVAAVDSNDPALCGHVRSVTRTVVTSRFSEENTSQSHRGISEDQLKRNVPLTSPSPTRPTVAVSSSPRPSASQSADRQRTPVGTSRVADTFQPEFQQPSTGSKEAAQDAATASPEAKSILQRLQLQLNQAERAAALQRAMHETVQREKEDLQVQMDELLHIQSELERRSQMHESALEKAKQCHAAEKLAWEVEGQTELMRLKAAHDAQLRQWESAKNCMQTQINASRDEALQLQAELADAREELRAVLEEQLREKQELMEARRAQTAAEQSCFSLQSKVDEARKAQEAAQQETQAVERLREAFQSAAERATVSELAFHTLCHQLTNLLECHNSPFNSSGNVALSTPGSFLRSDSGRGIDETKLTDGNTSVQLIVDMKRLVEAAMSEEGLAVEVQSTLSEQNLLFRIDRSSSPARDAANEKEITREEVTSKVYNETATAPKFHKKSDRTFQSSVNSYTLLQQHRQEVLNVLTAIIDRCCCVAREARAAADAHAAEMERVLSAELRLLRAQIVDQQQRELAKEQRVDVAVDVKLAVQDNAPSAGRSTVFTAETPPSFVTADNHAAANASEGTKSTASPQITEPGALQDELAAAKHALFLEQRHTALLRREIEDLRETRNTASLLAKVEEAVKDVHQSLFQLLQNAVDDMQKLERNSYGEALNSNSYDTNPGKGHWKRVHENGPNDFQPSSLPATDKFVAVHNGAAEQHVDRTLICSVRKAVLLAEAQVERVGEELLGETRRGRFQDAVNAFGGPPTPSSPANKCTQTSHFSSAQTRQGNDTCFISSRRLEEQQQVYSELQGLLHRSRVEESRYGRSSNSSIPPLQSSSPAAVSRYYPDGSRWLTGIRPPPAPSSLRPSLAQPSGAVVTPTRPSNPPAGANRATAPSPYVHAYVRSLEDGSTAPPFSDNAVMMLTQTYDTGSSALPSSTALRLFEGMMSTTQELRNVGNLLEVLRDNQETHVERRQACLLKWEERVKTALNEWLRSMQSTMATLCPQNIAQELFQRRCQDRQGAISCEQIPPLALTSANIVDVIPRQKPQVRLADVLAGKSTVSGISSTGAVCFPHRE